MIDNLVKACNIAPNGYACFLLGCLRIYRVKRGPMGRFPKFMVQ